MQFNQNVRGGCVELMMLMREEEKKRRREKKRMREEVNNDAVPSRKEGTHSNRSESDTSPDTASLTVLFRLGTESILGLAGQSALALFRAAL